MSRLEPMLKFDLDSVLMHGRVVPPLEDAVRARALARARATAVTAFLVPSPVAPRGGVPWGGLVPATMLGIGIAGAVFAWNERGSRHADSSPPALSVQASPSPLPVPSPVAPQMPLPGVGAERTLPVAPSTAAVTPKRGSQTLPQDSYEAELELLRRAHAAYASQEFTGALLVLAEHAHRFPSGRLAEEREALRVRSLAEVGRKDEARRAAVNFAARFPRSVLLSQIQKIAGTGEY